MQIQRGLEQENANTSTHTFEGAVAYTSDLRMYGARKDLTDDFVKEATESEPVALVCEGTRMALKEKRKNYSDALLLLALNPYPFSLSEVTCEP